MIPAWRRTRLLLLLAALPTAAWASGKITKLSAAPSPAVAGREVTVAVDGAGSCTAHITFGDEHGTFQGPLTLPAMLKHTYAKGGKYVVRVAPVYREGGESQANQLSTCAGFDDVLLTVNPPVFVSISKAKLKTVAFAPTPPSQQIRLADGRVFLLDPATGTVLFGDGVTGKRLPSGDRVADGKYRDGNGREHVVQGGRLIGWEASSAKALAVTPTPTYSAPR
jgi:hypothetical protein